nr:ankyrin repeat protein [Pandoravirus massiliensis]
MGGVLWLAGQVGRNPQGNGLARAHKPTHLPPPQNNHRGPGARSQCSTTKDDGMESPVAAGARSPIDALPDELLLMVFSLVACVERRRALSLVCHRWRAIVTDAPLGVARTIKPPQHRKARADDVAWDATRAGHVLCLSWICERRRF